MLNGITFMRVTVTPSWREDMMEVQTLVETARDRIESKKFCLRNDFKSTFEILWDEMKEEVLKHQ